MTDGATLHTSRSEFQTIRRLRMHVRRWGASTAPKLFMLHGWMDMSATFQFVVEALRGDWQVVAPDWAGFGLSGWRTGDYPVSAYVADLDELLDRLCPEAPVRLVAHSMGAQVATLYNAMRPERVAGFVNLDGLAPVPPDDAETELKRLKTWLDHQRRRLPVRTYTSAAACAEELLKRNNRLKAEQANFLAGQFTRPTSDGRVELLADPAYRLGALPRFPQAVIQAAIARIPGPMLWILGGRSPVMRSFLRAPDGPRLLDVRFGAAAQGRQLTLPHAGHNVQHDEPEEVAALIEEFMLGGPVRERLSASVGE